MARKVKGKSRAPVVATQRHKDIRGEIEPRLNQLIKLYESTDPALGKDAEFDKLENARTAIEIWWYVYADLMLWAQSHLAGYELARSNPEVANRIGNKLGLELSADSHVLELMGLMWSWNRVTYDDATEAVEKTLEAHKAGMPDTALRSLIRELLVSRSANSSFWRFPLQSAMFGLNIGHVDDLVEPEPVRRQGNPILLLNWKSSALMHVQYLIGKGLKKYRALEQIADGLGQSVETLRDWEKTLMADDDFSVRLAAARIAGQFENEIDRNDMKALKEHFPVDYHRNVSDIEWARICLKDIRATPIAEIKKAIRHLRDAKSGTRKRSSATRK
jgi:hypothetical protein